MSDLRLRARSVTEIVDAAFQVYKRDAIEYVLVTAIVLGLLGFFSYALMNAAISRFSSDVYLDRPTGLAMVIRSVVPTVPRLIGATILFALVVMLGFIPVLIGAAITSALLIFLGVVFSFFWVFYAFARFFAVFQIIVLENRGIITAFSRSGVLSRGRKGHIILTLLLVIVIFSVLSIAVTMVAALMGNAAGSVVLQSLYTVVAYPLIGITQMILYYDTRIRAEGFDIEVMTGALGTPTASTAS